MRRPRSRPAQAHDAGPTVDGAPPATSRRGRASASAALRQALAAIARTAAQLCEAQDALIFRVEGDALVLAAKHGRIPSTRKAGRPFPIDRGTLHGRAVIDRRTIHLRDMAASEWMAVPVHRAAQRATGARTMLFSPLLRDGRATGVMVIRRTRVKPFTARQVALLKTFAVQAAIAIDHAHVSAELHARNRDLKTRNRELGEALEQQTATSEILQVISGSPTEIEPVLDVVARNSARLCEAVDAAIFLSEGDVLRRVASVGPLPHALGATSATRPTSRRWVTGRCVVDRVPIHVDDLAVAGDEFPEGRALALQAGHHTTLAVPLLREGEAIGAILIRRGEVRPFSDTHIALLQTFAAQAVIAIENVRLFTELQARNGDLTEALERQTATAEILRAISGSTMDAQPVFQAIAESAVRLSGALFGSVYRFDGELVHMVAHHNYPEAALEFSRRYFPSPPGRRSFTGRAILERAVVHVPDVSQDQEREMARDLAEGIGFRSALSVPMLHEGSPIGAITVWRGQVGPFSDAHVTLVQTFADQAVIAIENVRLFTELQERNRDLTEALEQQTATAEILRVISASPTDVQPVFDAIVRSAARLCDSPRSNAMIVDGDLVHLIARCVDGELKNPRDVTDPFHRAFPMRIDESGLAGPIVREGRVFSTADAQHDERLSAARRRAAAEAGFHSLIGVPMVKNGVVIGALNVARTEVKTYSDREIALLQTFADQAVIAIENVRLFTELGASNRELEARHQALSEALEQQMATAEILRVISGSPTDIQPVLDVVGRNAARLCEARDVTVLLRDGDMLYPAVRVGELRGPHGLGDRVPISRGWVAGRAVLDRAPIHVADLATAAAEFPEGQAFTLRTGHHTTLAVPLMREGEAIGAIVSRRVEVRPFSDAHIALLRTFAAQAVIAIENVRLFTDLRARTAELTRSVQQLTALGEVGQAVGSTLDLETVLETIASRAAQLAGADACTVSEYDEQAEVFSQRVTHNVPEEIAAMTRARPVRKGEGAMGRLPMTREPEQISDISEPYAYRGPLREPLLRAGLRALLAMPLVRETHLVGALTVLRRTPGEFPPETVDLLRTFAAQSAIAIQNARLFREIEARGRQLEVASQHKSQFLANMSHELRTPLNAILGYTELIGDGIYGELPDQIREVLGRVGAGGRHLLGLINDILDLSKIEAGQLRLVLGDYAMADVVQSVAASAEPLAAAKSLELTVSMSPDLPLGWGDGRRLGQVLLNLVGNAIKFTDAGRVSVRAETAGDAFVVSVTDTGPGIADNEQGRIFEEFQQAETTIRRAKGGTGLGLAISRRIVEMHGGRLGVESTLGQGSTFTFTVPIRAPERAPAATAAAG